MKQKTIIGLCGDKFHGKDTAANALVMLGNFHRLAFADPLKECAAAAFGRPVEDFHNVALKEKPVPGWPDWTHRKVLEFLGTEVFRTNFPGIWMKTCMSKIDESVHDRFVITDLRFMDEVKAVQERGGKIIRIVNPRVASTPADPQECETLGLHPSMWQHHSFPLDAEIINDGDVVKLHVRMLALARSYGVAI